MSIPYQPIPAGSITPFVHIYELFAGIMSALVGVAEIRELTGEKFKFKFNEKSTKINTEITPILSLLKQYEGQKLNVPPIFQKGADELNEKSNTIKIWADDKLRMFNIETEKNKLTKIIYSLCVLSFLFCLSLLIIIAGTESHFFTEEMATRYVAHVELFVLPAMVWSAVYINKARYSRYSCFMLSAIIYTVSSFFAFAITINFSKHFEIYNALLVVVSLVMCTFPVLALIIRTFIFWSYRIRQFEKSIPVYKKDLNEIQTNYKEIFTFVMNKNNSLN